MDSLPSILSPDDEEKQLRALIITKLEQEGRCTDIINTFIVDKTFDRALLDLQFEMRKDIRDDIEYAKARIKELSKDDQSCSQPNAESGMISFKHANPTCQQEESNHVDSKGSGCQPKESNIVGSEVWSTVPQRHGAASQSQPGPSTSTKNKPRVDKRPRDSPGSKTTTKGKKAKKNQALPKTTNRQPQGIETSQSEARKQPGMSQAATAPTPATGKVLIIRGALSKLPEGIESGVDRASFILREVKASFPNERLKTVRPIGRDDILLIPTNQESVARMQDRANWKAGAFNKADFSVFFKGSRPSQPRADPANMTRVLHVPQDLFTADEVKAALNKGSEQVASTFRVRALATGKLTDVVRVVFTTLDFAKAADSHPAMLHGMGPFKFSRSHRTTPLKRCFRCSDFGHFAAVCTKAPMCFRCSGPHELRACPNERGSATKCGFCNQGHLAGTGDCPRRVTALLEAKAAEPKVSTLQRESQLILNSVRAQLETTSRSTKTYADVAAKSTAESTFQALIGPIQEELAKLNRLCSGLYKLCRASNPQMASMLVDIATPSQQRGKH